MTRLNQSSMQFFKSVSFVGVTLAIAASANPVPLANSASVNLATPPHTLECMQVGQEYCCCIPEVGLSSCFVYVGYWLLTCQ